MWHCMCNAMREEHAMGHDPGLQALALPKQHDTDVSVLASELNSQ